MGPGPGDSAGNERRLIILCFIPELVSWNAKLFTTLLSALAPPTSLVAPLRELRVACGLVFLVILRKVL